jgi:hypothetical protein
MSDIPSVVSGPDLQIKETVEYDLPCPKCAKDMRVTSVKEGALVKCKNCKNVTWRIRYVPPWWAKTWILISALVFALATGFASSWLFEKYQKSRDAADLPTAIKKK